MHLRLFLILTLLSVGFSLAPAQQPAPAPGQTYALLIGGLGGQGPYGAWYADWLNRFHSYLTKSANVPDANITALADKEATLDAITAAFGKIAQRAQPQDQFVLFIVGHGDLSGSAPTLILAGPDATATQIAALLTTVPAKNQVVLNFSASSGDFVKALSAPGRVILAATSPTELEEPVYAEFFLRGLESKRADLDNNGTITMLEAFNWAAQQTAFWIARWQETDTGVSTDADATKPPGPTVWKASGKETVEIFEKLYAGVPMRKLDPTSDRNAADAPADLVPPGGQVTADWATRRVVDEHAVLEDSGQGLGVSIITDKGIQLILGQKPGDPGFLAAHTVLGKAEILSP